MGLSKQYGKKDSEVSQLLNKTFGQWLLPPEEVCDCFVLEFLSNLPNDERVEQFCGYLLENYIDADSSLSPPVWPECSALSLRTINACELFHAQFNALYYSANHNFFFLYMYCNAVAQWLRCCATNRKVAGSISDGVIGIFH